MNTVTRKIRISPTGDDVKKVYESLYKWNELAFRAANTALCHMYFQNNMQEFFYLTDDARILFADIMKQEPESDKMHVLNTSKQNTTYQVLSNRYKGEMPSDIFSNLNAQLVSLFNKERKEYFSGKRSLRTYRRDMPMPISAKSLRGLSENEDGDYTFTLYGFDFKMLFGRDRSGNRVFVDRAVKGEYKLCNSSIQLDGKYIYLLAVFQFESEKVALDAERVMEAELGFDFPIILKTGKKVINIGDRTEYLHRRYAIQAALRRTQIASRYSNGGKGRKKKLAAIDRFEDKERNYIQTRQHQYTFKMVDACVKNKCGVLRLKLTPEPPAPEDMGKRELMQWKRENELLLRNWGYRGLLDKVKYKCKKWGIDVVMDK